MDIEKLAGPMAALIKKEVSKATAPLLQEIAELKARQPEKGDPGDPGKDAVVDMEAVAGLVNQKADSWALDFERRAQGVLERAVDRMPKPENGKDGENGADGKDGLGFDDLKVNYDGQRGFSISFIRGEQIKEFTFSVPVVLDKGYWKDGLQVEKGDGVTSQGSYWIALKDTATRPDIGNPDWRLAVKKGRDGKGRDGKDGERGPKGEKGEPGLNGRNLT